MSRTVGLIFRTDGGNINNLYRFFLCIYLTRNRSHKLPSIVPGTASYYYTIKVGEVSMFHVEIGRLYYVNTAQEAMIPTALAWR